MHNNKSDLHLDDIIASIETMGRSELDQLQEAIEKVVSSPKVAQTSGPIFDDEVAVLI